VFYAGGSTREVVEQKGLLGTLVREIRNGRLDFPDAYFDLIIINQVLEHVADLDQVLDEIDRVLASVVTRQESGRHIRRFAVQGSGAGVNHNDRSNPAGVVHSFDQRTWAHELVENIRLQSLFESRSGDRPLPARE
jgi:SAM-dependent methyltransferase